MRRTMNTQRSTSGIGLVHGDPGLPGVRPGTYAEPSARDGRTAPPRPASRRRLGPASSLSVSWSAIRHLTGRAKAIEVGIKAFKIYKEVNKAYDAVHAGERGAAQAAESFSKAKKAFQHGLLGSQGRRGQGSPVSVEQKAATETASHTASTEAKPPRRRPTPTSRAAGQRPRPNRTRATASRPASVC